MEKEIKAIVFDIGGVLYDEGDLEKLYSRLCEKFKLDFGEFFKIRKRYINSATIGKISAHNYPALIAKGLGVKDVKRFVKFWYKNRREELKLNKDIGKTLTKLRKNYIIATLTNITKTNDIFRNEKKIYRFFDIKLISNKEGMKKPDIKFYKLLIKKLNLLPRQVVFVDDEKRNLFPAKKLGIKTIFFKNNKQLIKDLKKFGVRI